MNDPQLLDPRHWMRPGTLQLQALPPLSLYIHLPWCLKKCPYCDFNSHEWSATAEPGQPMPEARYLDALRADLEASLPLIWGRTVHSVFIGGGTPSLFSPEAIDRLLGDVRARLRLDADAEIIEPVEGRREGGGAQAAIRNCAEEAITPGQLGFNGCRREHHQRHAIRTVVGFVERNKVGAQIPAGQIRQGIQVADRELGEGVGRVDRLLVHLIAAAHIVLQLEAVFGVDRVALFIAEMRIKGWLFKIIAKTIQSLIKLSGIDLE